MRNQFYFSLFTIVLFISLIVSLAPANYIISNPASFNFYNQPKNSFRYLTIDADVANNALSLASYNKHFNADPDWDSIQKTEILNLMPDLGFRVNTNVFTAPLEFYSRLFNISIYGRSYGAVNLPKDIFDIALFGNDLNRQYNLVGAEANTINYAGCAIGSAYPVIKPTDDNDISSIWSIKQLNVGARLHYQRGIIVAKTDSSSGFLVTAPDVFLAKVKLYQSYAQGGNCFAFDMGTTAELENQLKVGIAILNINTSFNWTSKPELRVYDIGIDSFSVQRYLDLSVRDIDSFVHTVDTQYTIPSFKAGIPAQFLIEASYPVLTNLMVSSYYHQYFSKSRFIVDFTKSFNINLYYTPIRFFATGLSFTTDLKKNIKIGHSIHFIVRGFNFNLCYKQRNGYITSPKGLDLGLSFAQNW